MALITSDCDAMQLPEHQMALITSDCAPFRYGLIGTNGSGKTNLINSLALREVPIPEHVDMFHLHREATPTDRSAIESLIDHVQAQLAHLEKMSDDIMEQFGPEDMRLVSLGERIEELDPATFEVKARKVLNGLGFSEQVVPMGESWLTAAIHMANPYCSCKADTCSVALQSGRPSTCPAAGVCVSRSARRCSQPRRSCCWTSRPTTWTWRRASGWRST